MVCQVEIDRNRQIVVVRVWVDIFRPKYLLGHLNGRTVRRKTCHCNEILNHEDNYDCNLHESVSVAQKCQLIPVSVN
jgi:hypothetical protein